jgi:glycosyltransferase involved in cell wall biosynthesis
LVEIADSGNTLIGRRVCFILSDLSSSFEGIARVFINWSIELQNHGNEIYFVLLNCAKRITQTIQSRSATITIGEGKNITDVVNFLKSHKPEILMSDDNLGRMKLLLRLKKKLKVRTCVYVQILYGVHSVVDSFDVSYLRFKERLTYQLTRLVPFSLLKSSYKRALLSQDIVIANSQITATLLHTWYGVEPQTIVYPPVDRTVFRRKEFPKDANQVLLYLGSHAGDTNKNLVRKICEILRSMKSKVLVFGNNQLQISLSREFELEEVSEVSDEKLAELYCCSKLIICPQHWETFGYVIAESIACGTPVLSFNLMGQGELGMLSNCVLAANNEKEFLKKINDTHIKSECQGNISHSWDSTWSAEKLNYIIRNYE